MSGWLWATVTSTAPLRVRPDGEAAPVPSTPVPLVAGLVVGDRVWCQIEARSLIVHGKAQ